MHPISEILCEVYDRMHQSGLVRFPLQESHRRALDSIVKTVNAQYFGVPAHPTPEDRAAAYFCYIIKGHPAIDGNKRLAVLWLDFYCSARNLKPNPPVSFDRLAVTVEKSDALHMRQLIRAVREILF